jgi:class 3 adenylate cyclase
MQDDTLHLEKDQEDSGFLDTGFELNWVNEVGDLQCYRINRTRVFLGGGGGRADLRLPGLPPRAGNLHFTNQELVFTLQDSSTPCSVNGQPVTLRVLRNGDWLRLGSTDLRVIYWPDYPAMLEGYPPPRPSYALVEGANHIGRTGKRDNQVVLQEATVSRTHATLHFHRLPEASLLEAETSASPTRVNGEDCPLGQAVVLNDGDLLQFGSQVLRFRRLQAATRRELCAQEATILFSDVWDYSTLSERHPLDQMIRQMNEFYSAQGRIIQSNQGILMTFLGDALMAVFGTDGRSREGAVQAARAGLAMQACLAELNRDWAERGLPSLKIGVGINTGEVMVGDVGFTGRLEFAAMGDNTNLAARLEKLTREQQVGIIVSGSTGKLICDSFCLRPLGTTQVKGRQAEVEICEVLGPV